MEILHGQQVVHLNVTNVTVEIKKGRRKGRQERKEKRKEGSFHKQLILKIANESKTALGCWPFVKSFQSWRFLGPWTVG